MHGSTYLPSAVKYWICDIAMQKLLLYTCIKQLGHIYRHYILWIGVMSDPTSHSMFFHREHEE